MNDIKVIAAGKPAEKGEKILQRRYDLAKSLTRITQSGGRLLDVGCGNGAQTILFASHFDQVIGYDIQVTPMLESQLDIDWIAGAGENLPFKDNYFNAITCFEVLEHVSDPVETLKEFRRVLKPDGEIVISVPNKWWIFETHGAYLPLLPWNRVPFFSWLPEKIHDRWAKARIYSRAKLIRTLQAAGLSTYKLYYITAPMDRARPKLLQKLLQKTIFSSDLTSVPFLSVNHLAIIKK
ncbi:class I SAM-dependent methyltransferase [Calditrichota bacterium]